MKLGTKTLTAGATMIAIGSWATSAQAGILTALQNNVGESLQYKFTAGTTEANTWAGTNESTWGVGKLTDVILTGSGNPIWAAGDDDEEITFILYGIADAQVSGSAPNVNIWNVGATGGDADGFIHIDFYVDSFATSDTDFTIDGPADRTAFGSSGDWTDGTLLMQWVLDPGTVGDLGDGGFDESLATLFQQVQASSLPTEGSGQFYASCVSANLICSTLDTNMFTTTVGGQSDFEGQFTLENQPRGLWDGDVNDPVEAFAQDVPEPATTGLLGLGVLALAGLRRLRRGSNT